jgi:8-oxo-dGTP pyrophosphatase MutT (NUDIX family)
LLFRNCAGGVVFYKEKVFLLKNEKEEWVLPKGVIRNGSFPTEVALLRVKEEAGIKAIVVSPAGETCYEFYSITRQQPVCNKIIWYIMDAESDTFKISKENDFFDGGFFPIEEALDKITYSQDRSLVRLSYQKYKELLELK